MRGTFFIYSLLSLLFPRIDPVGVFIKAPAGVLDHFIGGGEAFHLYCLDVRQVEGKGFGKLLLVHLGLLAHLAKAAKMNQKQFTGIPYYIMQQKTRKKEVVEARQIAMTVLKKHSNLSLKNIGKLFGNRDHTTVLHALATIRDLVETDNELRRVVFSISPDVVVGIEERFDYSTIRRGGNASVKRKKPVLAAIDRKKRAA